jgi:hypothetical protein
MAEGEASIICRWTIVGQARCQLYGGLFGSYISVVLAAFDGRK